MAEGGDIEIGVEDNTLVEGEVCEKSSVPSLLERLKWPEKSGLARKHKVKTNPGPSVGMRM